MLSKNLFKKTILSLLITCNLLFIGLFPMASAVHAQQTWFNQDFQSWFKRVYAEPKDGGSPSSDVFGERYTAAQVQWIYYGLVSLILNGFTGSPSTTACILTNKDLIQCKLEEFFGSILDKFKISESSHPKNAFAYILLEDRPLSGITYFKNIARNLHIIPEASAQTVGFGFGALNPVLSIWRASRNVAYGLLVVAILAISFMIMFRVKINPQTVISVQSALPKIIFALILITFSYAIAGFLVDLMYVVIGLLSLSVAPALGIGTGVLFNSMVFGPGNWGVLGSVIIYSIAFAIALCAGMIGAAGILGILLGEVVVGAGVVLTGGIGGFILLALLVLILIMLLIMIIRIMWMLLRTFAYVILLVAFVPLQIAIGVVVPSMGFGTWIRAFISNLAVFPVTGLFFALAFLFLLTGVRMMGTDIFSGNALNVIAKLLFGGVAPAPINVQSGWPPLLGMGSGTGQGLIFLGVSLVLFLVLPRVVEIIQGLISGRPFAFGTAIGESVGPITGAGKFGLGIVSGAVQKGGVGYFGPRVQAGLGRIFGKGRPVGPIPDQYGGA